jgi:tetratricopeptide (TPR) repeat protein
MYDYLEVNSLLGGSNKKLLEIEKLYIFQKYQEAYLKLEEFERKDDLSKEEELRSNILRAVIIRHMDKWKEGLELLEQTIEESEHNEEKLILLDALLMQADYLRVLERYDDILAITERGLEIIEKEETTNQDLILRKGWFLSYKGLQENFKGNYDLSQETLEQGINQAKQVKNDNLLRVLCSFYARNEASRGNYIEAYEYNIQAVEISIRMKNDLVTARMYGDLAEAAIGLLKFRESQEILSKAIKIYQEYGLPVEYFEFILAMNYTGCGLSTEGVKIFKRILPQLEKLIGQNPRNLSFIIWGKAMVEWYEGNLDKALEFQEEVYNINVELGNRLLIATHAVFLAGMLIDASQIDKALELSLAALEDYEEYNHYFINSFNYEDLGKIFQIKGEYDLALDYLEKCLKIRSQSDHLYQLIRTLFFMIDIAIDKDDEVLYNKYLAQMEEAVFKDPLKIHDQYYRIANALVLKASSSPENWIGAIDSLEEVVEEEIYYYYIKVIALINLCELLMDEFSLSGNIEILEKLENYSNKLEEIANTQKQTSYSLRIESKNIRLLTIWLRAQHSMQETNLMQAENLLKEAREIAKSEGLTRLVEKLIRQQEKLYNQILRWI